MKYVNFSQLRSFHAVAQTESITLASKLLNISQPTITKQIQLLEEFYSISVINRHARGVTLTELGKKLFVITSNLFELEEEAINLFSSDLNIHKGTIITGTSGTYYIIKLIKEFKKLHPGIQLKIISTNSNDILDKIYNYKIDIGVIAKPLLKNFKSDIYSVPYLKQEIVLIVGKNSNLYTKSSISLEDINGYDFINREVGSETRRVFEECLKEKKINLNTVMEVDRTTMVQAVKENIGIGIISEPEFYDYKDIKKLHLKNVEIFTQAYLICLKKKKKDNLINAFIETAKTIIN
jgi:LysR family transcriptional regulator, low CO2-responsive transcriptional regulator